MSVSSPRPSSWQRRLSLVLGSVALAALSACGGSGTRVLPYAPTAMVAFGDEDSLLTSTGAKYTLNTVDATSLQVDCNQGQIWTQALATSFGMAFSGCNPTGIAVTAVMKAAVGAKVADVRAQVAAYKANNTLTNQTLVTLMAGTYDVLAAYNGYASGLLTRDQALAQVAAAGLSMGQLVNEVTDGGNGARVIYATVPDIGYSPFAIAELAANPTTTGGVDRQQLLKDLVAAFNAPYRLTVINEGQWAGLIIADDMIGAMAKNPALFAVANVDTAACLATAPLPSCTTSTVTDSAGTNAPSYLWADNKHMGLIAQIRLGLLAQTRAHNNPF